jgi:hypothetical protein
MLGLAARDAAACVDYRECQRLDPCRTNFRCVNGECLSDPVVCPSTACNPGHCDPVRGCEQRNACEHTFDDLNCNGFEYCLPVLVPPGFFVPVCTTTGPVNCDDGDDCTIDSACTEGVGCTNTPLNCDDGDPCTTDSCSQGVGCSHSPPIVGCCRTGADCESPCTPVGNSCVDNFCVYQVLDCDDGDDCTDDYCDYYDGCVHERYPDHDCVPPPVGCRADAECASPCTTGRTCVEGTCTAGAPLVCDDGDACTIDSCDPATGCATAPRAGFDVLACVCERGDPAVCLGQPFPRSLAKRSARGCKAVSRAKGASGRKRTKFVTKAAVQFERAAKVAAKSAGRDDFSADCAQALATRFADNRTRAITVRAQP